MTVTVQRVETTVESRREPIAHRTVERRTADLPRGEQRELTSGADGEREITERVVTVDGAVESREELESRVVRAPRDRLVEVGTGPAAPPDPEPAQPAAAEPAPAQPAPSPPPQPPPSPDSERDPQPGPEPEPEPAAANVQEGGASWYDNPYGGYTAAHRTLPRGTIVTVTNLANGKQVQVRINDRGPYVDGRVIDLNREAFAQIGSVSRGVIRVRLEW
jgi:hypothetical protein